MDFKKEIFAILDEAVGQIKSNIDSVGANVTGKTKNSFQVFEQGNIIGIEAARYWATLETGRGPGKVPYDFKNTIMEWMRNRGLWQSETESRKNSIAFRIAEKIKNEGTSLFRDKGRSDVFSNVINDSLINTILDKSGNILLKEISNGINSNLPTSTSIKF